MPHIVTEPDTDNELKWKGLVVKTESSVVLWNTRQAKFGTAMSEVVAP